MTAQLRFPAGHTGAISCSLWSSSLLKVSARVIGDRGELRAETRAVHRRIPVSELARYQAETRTRRRSAMAELTGDVTEATPADRVIETR